MPEPSKEEMFAQMPDIWYSQNDGTRMEFRCIGGLWHWKRVDEDGNVLGEGLGAP